MIHNSKFSQFQPNQISYDELGRPQGILLVDKPVDMTSHDVVAQMRRQYNTRKVGHAGTLDPFATGLLIILIGRATKLSNHFLEMDKTYEADILFGVQTNTGDTEGAIIKQQKVPSVSIQEVETILESFQPSYMQYVPVFSSVKVAGDKLRVLARKNDTFHVFDEGEERIVEFIQKDQISKRVPLPKKMVHIYAISLLSHHTATEEDRSMFALREESLKAAYVVRIRVQCSKGTYIRQLAEDIGARLSVPSCLIRLRRTGIGEFLI